MEKITVNTLFETGGYYFTDLERYDVYENQTRLGPDIEGVGKKVAFYIKNKKNIMLDFNGAILFLHGKIQPFLFENCENVTVKNCIIKYDRSSVTEGRILDRGEDFLRVHLNSEHTCRVEDGDLIPYSDTWENRDLDKYLMFINTFDTETRQGSGMALGVIGKNPQIDHSLPYSKGAMELLARADGDDVILKGINIPDNFAVGQTLVISHEPRNVTAFTCVDCTDVFIENFRIVNGVGMGIMPIHSKNIYIDGLKMFYDGLSSGFTTNGADGIHSFACSGVISVKNSIIESMVDDAINIHSNFYTIVSANGNSMKLYCNGAVATTDIKIFGKGDVVRVYRGKTMETVAEYTVTDVKVSDKKYIEIITDKAVLPHSEGDVVNNISAVCDLFVQNCRIGKSPASHMRFQNGGKAVLENCVSDFQLMLTGDMSYWYESHPVTELVVRNCRFCRSHANIVLTPQFFATENEPYYHRVLNITDCEFVTETPLNATYAEKVVFRGNTNADGREMTVRLVNCGEALTDNCKVERITEQRTELQAD